MRLVSGDAGEATPDGMQRLLNDAVWDVDEVRDQVGEYVVERLGDAEAVLVGDDTGFLKKGTESAGVQRQYSGAAGRTDTCKIGTFLAYASQHGRTLIDWELCLPEHTWIADRERCRAAGIGDEIAFATKPKQFQAIPARTLDAGGPFAWVTADEAFGQNTELRAWMADRDVAFVMATRSTNLATPGGVSVAGLVADQPAGRWHRRSAGTGAHGERIYDWLRIAVPCDVPGRKRWVLARRSISDGGTCLLPLFRTGERDVEDPGRGRRRPVGHRGVLPDREERVRAGPLPGPQVRRLVSAHHAVDGRPRLLARDRRGRTRAEKGAAADRSDELVDLSLAEIRRLFTPIGTQTRQLLFTIGWSIWRRRHQKRAQRSHFRRRGQTPP